MTNIDWTHGTEIPPEALPEAITSRDAVMDLYLQLYQRVEPVVCDATRRYLSGLSAWIRGNLDWSINSARYRRPGHATIAVSGDLTRPLPHSPRLRAWPGGGPGSDLRLKAK